jgi:Uma2 family endonuclease
MSTKTLLTLAEFEQLPEQEGVRYELDEGELVAMTFPVPEHNRVIKRIFVLLNEWLRGHPVGEIFFPDTGFVLSREPATLRGPDLSFLCQDRLGRMDPKQNIEGAPELAIEVVSPSDSAQALNKKVDQYLRSGARSVWVVYPDIRQVHVHTALGVRKLAAEEILDQPDLLPGFSAPVRTLFEE